MQTGIRFFWQGTKYIAITAITAMFTYAGNVISNRSFVNNEIRIQTETGGLSHKLLIAHNFT